MVGYCHLGSTPSRALIISTEKGLIMVGQHCGILMDTIHDGCIKVDKQCRKCHVKFSQRKRRPKRTPLTECTRFNFCDDHPGEIEWESKFREYLMRGYGIEDKIIQNECIIKVEQLLVSLVIQYGRERLSHA